MLESLKKNKKGISIMMLSSLFACFGQLFWKLSNGNKLIYLGIGFFLYGIGALLMLYAYKFGKLSVLQPVMSANYVFTIIIAHFILKEAIDIFKILGIIIIIMGVVLIGSGDSQE